MRSRALLLLLLTGACGSAQTQPTTPVPPPPARPAAAPTPPVATSRCGSTQGMTIEGQLGTIAPSNVRQVMRDAESTLMACYTRRVEALPCLSGRVEFRIRVGEDGAVRGVLEAHLAERGRADSPRRADETDEVG